MINQSKLEYIITNIQSKKVLVIGDIMLDKYVFGSVRRISPEAPIPVINVENTKLLAGGAGNVIKNLNSLNIKTSFISIIGNDSSGKFLKTHFKKLKNIEYALLQDSNRKTTLKTRYIANGQQLFRTDEETISPLSSILKKKTFQYFKLFIKQSDIIIFSDYGKALFIEENFCQKLIKYATKEKKKVIVDPKGDYFEKYKGSYFITPNTKEASNATFIDPKDNKLVEKCGQYIIQQKWAQNVLLTRGENGLSIIQKKNTYHLKSNAEEVFDVTGAGDTVIALFSAALSITNNNIESAHFANLGASIAVKKLGTSSVSQDEILEVFRKFLKSKTLSSSSLLNNLNEWRANKYTIGFTNGCFDLIHAGHIDMLKKAAESCDKLIVAVNSDKSIKKLKGNKRPILNLEARKKILRSLEMVDFVISFEEDTPIKLIKQINPNILFKGADYKIKEIVGANFIKKNGGSVIRINLTKNHSTTKLVSMIKNS
ncbi:MAG: Bifunctional protein HldE [Alphaproteobacteria bacterium MarineAlpha9_Bin3]|nr:MAG: Bifunctional protein HldE [Alphaproteobacteria bacterium MarineAlpha9_Bin3]|tara:strand:+ start:1391 stop:2845 length:1455 start_codon:yes stop_codon:yes gene_type:complete